MASASSIKKRIETDFTWYEWPLYKIGIIRKEMLEEHQYSFGYYFFSFLVALLIGLSCAFVTSYFMLSTTGLLWLAILVGGATLTLNGYLYFADTVDFLHTMFGKESFDDKLWKSCEPEGASTESAKEPGTTWEKLCHYSYYYLSLSFLTQHQLYYFKVFCLGIIGLMVVADGIANGGLALAGAQGLFMTLGAATLAAGPLPYLFALASIIGNAALIFVTLRAVLLNPRDIWHFIKNVFVPDLEKRKKADWKYATKCFFRGLFFLAALVAVSIATIAIAAVWKKDFGAFLVTVLGVADTLASKIAVIVVWGLGLLPEMAFAWKCAGKIATQIVTLIEKLIHFSETYDAWKRDCNLQSASTFKILWELICLIGGFIFKCALIGLNAYGNGRLGQAGADAIKLDPFLVDVSAIANSTAAMGTAINAFGTQPPSDTPLVDGNAPPIQKPWPQ